MIKTFEGFSESPTTRPDVAGVAIVLKQPAEPSKILIVHPTNGSWKKPIMGIPKGRIEDGESPIEAGLRELFEETGIELTPSQLEPGVNTAEVWKDLAFRNNIYYTICRIEDPAEIGLNSVSVPRSQLQAEEVDWAGFVDIDQAYSMVTEAQRIILDRIR